MRYADVIPTSTPVLRGAEMRNARAVFGLVLFFAVAAVVTFAEEQQKKIDGKTIFEQRCIKCHSVDKFKSMQHDRQGWEIILNRMQRSKNCVLTDDEVNAVAEYLAKKYGE
jgi:mono/diheme cytochrome c family protein